MNENHHAASIHVSNYITLPTDLVHMLEVFEIAYALSRKLRRRSWVRNGGEGEQYLPKPTKMIYMP
jgi:hypothetical protein